MSLMVRELPDPRRRGHVPADATYRYETGDEIDLDDEPFPWEPSRESADDEQDEDDGTEAGPDLPADAA